MTRRSRAFTLVELLVVVSIIGLLVAMIVPSLSSARRAAQGTACMSNMRALALAQMTYAGAFRDRLVVAGEGSYDVQGSWIGLLEGQGTHGLARRCPLDRSPHFTSPFTDFDPPVLRHTSYGVNNYVSPTHAPLGATPVERLSQIRRPSEVIQFAELAETGNYAVADHLHVQEFFKPLTPQATPARVSVQMPLGRHGGRKKDWSGVTNFSYFDGHAGPQPLKNVYRDPGRNRFNPALAP